MTSLAATQFLPVVAAANAASSFVVVSLHDIAPSNRETTAKILAELARRNVRVCSLLVVPDYHHREPITKDRECVSWLRELESAGHEVVIHGYFHERPRHVEESLREKFITRFYTHNEGEFFDLDYDEALRRISMARDAFTAVGLKPLGFVAPAWLLSPEAEQAARDSGIEYTTRLRVVRDLRTYKDFSARSLVYSVRNQWRRGMSLVWNAGLHQLAKHKPLLRLSIHPPDYFHPAIWSQITRFIDETVPIRIPTTYRDWIAEQRVTGAFRE